MLHKDEQIGDYRLERFLGRGQFGEVWLAEKKIGFASKTISRALKFLMNRAGGEVNVKVAQDEIDTWIEVGSHPNVISVLDMLVHDGNIVIISEYADGGSLKDWLKLHHGKAPTQEEAIELMIGILRGIEHLHSRNVIHRDLKPENILLHGGFPRITDFGISRIVSENQTVTQAVGSPTYMSPEAFLGNKSSSTDIWSAGVILYEMLTGSYPFIGENIFLLKELIDKEDPRPMTSDIGRELQGIVKQALEKDRRKRIKSAREMRLMLEAAAYNLRKSAAVDDMSATQEDPISVTQRVHTESDPTLPEQINLQQTLPDQTQASPTNYQEIIKPPTQDIPAETQYTPVVETDEKILEKTQDWQSVENEKRKASEQNKAQGADFIKLKEVAAIEPKSSSTGVEKFLIAGVAAIVLISLAIGGYFAFRPSTPTTIVTNTNSAPTNSNSTPTDNPPIVPDGMAYIPGGEFMMGRDDGKSDAEKPAHKATVKPFFMDKTEVTNEKYAEFMKAENYRAPAEWKGGTYPSGQAKYPVIGVNWEDARAYAKWASKRLPTEEEWEFAARGKEGFLYPWGNEWKKGNANADGASKTFAEVGKFKGASPFGLYDMVGNVWEWTASDFNAYPNGKLPDVFKDKENLKALRGGSFEATPDFATTTYRIGYAATSAENFYQQTGFRCAKDIK